MGFLPEVRSQVQFPQHLVGRTEFLGRIQVIGQSIHRYRAAGVHAPDRSGQSPGQLVRITTRHEGRHVIHHHRRGPGGEAGHHVHFPLPFPAYPADEPESARLHPLLQFQARLKDEAVQPVRGVRVAVLQRVQYHDRQFQLVAQ